MNNKRVIPLLLLFPTLAVGTAIADTEVERAKNYQVKIINGEDTKEGQWPYMTALVYPNSSAFDGQFCGSTFIGNKYVLTASHCVDQANRNSQEVIVGIHDLEDDNQGQRVTVKQIYMHEKYDSITTANDIAILELTKSLSSPAAKLAEADLFSSLAPGEELTVTGWGNQEQDSFSQPIYPNILSSVSIPLVSNYTCRGAGGGYSSIGDDAFCAGLPQGGKDSCQGDSGGPMYVNDGGEIKQLGVVSWGEGCAEAGKYGVYANVSYFADWIKAKTAGISYTQKDNLGFTEKGYYKHTFNIENTTDQELLLDNITLSDGAKILDNGCEAHLAIDASCDVEIGYLVDEIGYGEAKLTVDTNHPVNPNLEMKLHYTALKVADSDIADIVDIPGSRTLVNENSWFSYKTTGLQSDEIQDNEWSILAISNLPEGDLKFDLGVSSEEDYDKLEIRVNGANYDTISGNVTLPNTVINLPEAINNIAFIYSKDETDENDVGDDRAWLNNISFEAAEGTTVPWTDIDDNATPVKPPVVTVPWIDLDPSTPIDLDPSTPIDQRVVIETPTEAVNPPSIPEIPATAFAGESFKILFNLAELNKDSVKLHEGDFVKVTVGKPNTRLSQKPYVAQLSATDIQRGWAVVSTSIQETGKYTITKSVVNSVTNENYNVGTSVEVEVGEKPPVTDNEVRPVTESSGGSMNLALLFGLPLLAFTRRKKQK